MKNHSKRNNSNHRIKLKNQLKVNMLIKISNRHINFHQLFLLKMLVVLNKISKRKSKYKKKTTTKGFFDQIQKTYAVTNIKKEVRKEKHKKCQTC